MQCGTYISHFWWYFKKCFLLFFKRKARNRAAQKMKFPFMLCLVYVISCYVKGARILSSQKGAWAIEIKPYSFRFSWRMICHQGCVLLSSKSFPRTYKNRCAWGFSQIWTDPVWGAKWKKLFWFIWHHWSDLLSSKDTYWLSKYIHWVREDGAIAFWSILWCTL